MVNTTLVSHVRGLADAALDWLDLPFRSRLRHELARPIPPLSIRRRVAPLDEYLATTDEYIAYFKLLGGLHMRSDVLDIGCGHGRFIARMLTKPHYFRGAYEGFDSDPVAIRWAQGNITSELARVHFRHIDLHNAYYSPTGQVDPTTLRCPYPDDSFDFVLAWSIFTHLRPSVVDRYFQEVARVLRPGKCFIATCFALDGYPNSLRSDLQFSRLLPANPHSHWEHHDTWSTLFPDAPERAIGLQLSYLRAAGAKQGLVLKQFVPGSWNCDDDYLSLQDIMVWQRPPPTGADDSGGPIR